MRGHRSRKPIGFRQWVVHIARDIENLDEKTYPYLVFKSTSCDDGIECWFETWSEEEGNYKERSLKDLDETVTEFVLIDNGKIAGFIDNTSYHYD